jgi:D-glycero-D-manno-heptose 1,7-bisphosphate phosphatase
MPYIILDRDGVINLESPNFIKSPEEWIAIPQSLIAIAQLTALGYQIIIATNQSGLARQYYTHDMLDRIHEKMLKLIRDTGGDITDIFYCPHGPDDHCHCRKPKIGLYEKIRAKYPDINLSQTYSVGDSLRDLQAAQRSGCLPVLVKTGNGLKTAEKINLDPDFSEFKNIPVFDNLQAFSDFLNT